MKLAVDSNILFSFFKRESKTREIIVELQLFDFCTLRSRIDELTAHRNEICRKARISPEDFSVVLSELGIFVEIIDDAIAFDRAGEAIKIAPHIEDAPLFALSLKIDCGIWSNEKAFKKQSKVKVFDTKEMIELLEG